jgi:hypothetical protein
MKKRVTTAIFTVVIPRVFDKCTSGICLGGGDGHGAMISVMVFTSGRAEQGSFNQFVIKWQ